MSAPKMERLNMDNWLMQGKIKAAMCNNTINRISDRRGRRPQRSGPMVAKPLNISESCANEAKRLQSAKQDHWETRAPKLTPFITSGKAPVSAPPSPINGPPPLLPHHANALHLAALQPRRGLSPRPNKPLLLPKPTQQFCLEKAAEKKLAAENAILVPPVNLPVIIPSTVVLRKKTALKRPTSMLVLPTEGLGSISTRSRPPSPSYYSSGRRTPSPGSALDPALVETVRRRVRNVQRARLYLLQQPGPHSFLVVADSPEHKYKVIIGPQSCTCGKGPHCIHVLFVMLRVFQSRETDPKLFAKTLKNFEVEELIKQFQARRKKQMRETTNNANSTATTNTTTTTTSFGNSSATVKTHHPETPSSKSTLHRPTSRSESSLPEVLSARQNSTGQIKSNPISGDDESPLCPICLLEMVEGESLVTCEKGCRNKLHQHCISIWADECRRQNERILCPLCRAEWPIVSAPESPPFQEETPRLNNNQHLIRNFNKQTFSKPSNHPRAENLSSLSSVISSHHPTTSSLSSASASSSSSSSLASTLTSFSNLNLKTSSHFPETQTWLLVFGNKFVSSLLSQNWSHRENALKWLSRQVVSILSVSKDIPDQGGGQTEASQAQRLKDCNTVFEACCKVVASMIKDPVYKVYVAALRCFRAVLTYSPIRGDFELLKLQQRVKPIVKAILLKCADGNRRTTQLSIATVIEISHGQTAAMAVGQHTDYPALNGLGGVEFILNCALEDEPESPKVTKHWKWLLGRLAIAERLLEEFPSEFSLLYVNRVTAGITLAQATKTTTKDGVTIDDETQLRHLNYQRLVTVLEFAKKTLVHPHSTVNKLASRVFVMASRFTACVPPVFSQVFDMITDIDVNVQRAMIKKLEAIMDELHLPEGIAKHAKTSKFAHLFGRNLETERIQEQNLVQEKLISDEEDSALRRSSFERFSGHSLSFSFENSGGHSGVKKVRPSYLPLHQTLRPTTRPNNHNNTNNNKTASKDQPLKNRRTCSASSAAASTNGVKLPNGRNLKRELHFSFAPRGDGIEGVGGGEDDTDLLSPTGTLTPSCSSGICSPVSFNSEIGEDNENETITLSASDCKVVDWKLSVTKTLRSPKTPDSLCFEFYETFPIIPGLRDSPDEELVISLQPDLAECKTDLVLKGNQECCGSFTENVHWRKGPLLGTGAFSSCYQARDKRTGILMAVKQLSFYRNNEVEQEKVMEAIRDEIVMMSKLRHPNVIRLLGATQQGGHYNVFVEWMAGGSVASLLDRYGPFNEHVILRYAWQVLDGLAYLHENQILHRDLKGANLLVDSNGHHLRIADFGAAARLRSQSTVAGEFQGQLLGTIAFMAPEVLRGEDYGRSCDVWSVGCILIEMATAKPPWNANDVSNHLALIFKIACSNAPPNVPDFLSRLTQDLTLQCLQLKSEERPHAKDLLNHPCFHQSFSTAVPIN